MARREAAPEPIISVVIPVLNGADVLGGCLDALAAQQDASQWELLVVDNGSTDDTVASGRAPPGRRPRARTSRRGVPTRPATPAWSRREARSWRSPTRTASPTSAGWRLVSPRCGPAATSWGARSSSAGRRGPRSGSGTTAPPICVRIASCANRASPPPPTSSSAPPSWPTSAGFRPELVASGDLEFGRRATGAGYALAYAADARILHHPRTTIRDTWALHRKLGSGFAELARAGLRGSAWRDPALHIRLRDVTHMVAEDGPYVHRRRLAPVHAVACSAVAGWAA